MVLAESTHLEQMLWGRQGFAGLPQHSLPGSHEQQLLMETMLALPCSKTEVAITAWMCQAQHFSLYPFLCLFCAQHKGEDSL